MSERDDVKKGDEQSVLARESLSALMDDEANAFSKRKYEGLNDVRRRMGLKKQKLKLNKKIMAKSKRTAHRKNILMLATCNVSAPQSKTNMFLRIALRKQKLNEHARRNAELHLMNRQAALFKTSTTKRSRQAKQKKTVNIAYFRSFDTSKLLPQTKRQRLLQQTFLNKQ